MIRGSIYSADLGDPVGHEQGFRRPVLVVASQAWLDRDPAVIATLSITRSRRARPYRVEIEPDESGLSDVSYIVCEDIRAISPLRLGRFYGRAGPVVMAQVDSALRRLLLND